MERHAANVWTSLIDDPLLEPAGTATKTMKRARYETLRLAHKDMRAGFRLYETMTAAEQKAGLRRASKKVPMAKARSLLAAECGIMDGDSNFQRVASTLPPHIKAELSSLRAMSTSERTQRLEALKNYEVLELLLHLTRLLGTLKTNLISVLRMSKRMLFLLGASIVIPVLFITTRDAANKGIGAAKTWVANTKRRRQKPAAAASL